MAETGAKGPTLEDVIFLILEDVLGQAEDTSATTSVRRHRALHEHRGTRATASSSAHLTRRRGRSLRTSHPMTKRRKCALRANQLQFNRFTRPLRRSKYRRLVEGLDTIIEKPLELLSEVSFLTDLFGTGSSTTSSFDFAADISMTSGAHLGVMGE